jgi:hypothetical protein
LVYSPEVGRWIVAAAAGLLQQSELPIGHLGELADRIRKRFVERRQPLAGTPAIPDIFAKQVRGAVTVG